MHVSTDPMAEPLNVAVIGAGALGSRHLQALALLDRPLNVSVADPSPRSLELAATRLQEVGGLKRGTVELVPAASAASWQPSIGIVATNSRERLGALRELLDRNCRKIILEKVLFTSLRDYEEAEELLAATKAECWVNCSRRAYPGLSALEKMLGNRPISYRVAGAGWGLGCNVIHHLDEFAILAGQPIATIETTGLAPGWIAAKRSGYVEFLGTLTASTASGDRFEATCAPGTPGDRIVRLEGLDVTLLISQQHQTLTVCRGEEISQQPYPMPLQSVSTAAHITAMASGVAPALPSWRESFHTHRLMIAAFLRHLRRTSEFAGTEECPIT